MNEYTIHALAQLSGVSSRTLRHYDQIGLLKPLKKNQSGYRVYGTNQVDMLQQILLYKQTGLGLGTIKKILADPKFNVVQALKDQKQLLLQQRQHLEEIIATIETSIKYHSGEIDMTDDQKFTQLKQQLITENDRKYGEEVKQKWGEETWKQSNQQFMNMSKEQFEKMTGLEQEFKTTLQQAFEVGDPAGETAKKAVDLHRQWLCIFWPSYSIEAHQGLAQMYIDDVRFHHYFNDNLKLAEFFRDAVNACKETM